MLSKEEVEELRSKLLHEIELAEDEADQARARLENKKLDLDALERTWKLVCISPKQPRVRVPLPDGGEARPQRWEDRVMAVVDSLGKESFSVGDVKAALISLGLEDTRSNAATVSGTLKRLEMSGVLRCVEPGRGARGSVYSVAPKTVKEGTEW